MIEERITSSDLFNLGFESGKTFGEALSLAKSLQDSGTPRSIVLERLKEMKDSTARMLGMREGAGDIAVALKVESPEDEENLNKVLTTMKRLSRSPVVRATAVMPDACPAGGEDAAITVGGAIAVENAIVPYSTSADLCCSMHATFFTAPPSRTTSELMDALQASTRFGAGGRRPHEIVRHPVTEEPVWQNTFLSGLKNYAEIHMADQGDGNHFAYIGRISGLEQVSRRLMAAGHEVLGSQLSRHDNLHVLVTHHGSRGLGAQVYKRGLCAAIKHTKKVATGIPKAAAWLDFNTTEGQAYWEAMQYVGRWTLANHQSIHQLFLEQAHARKVAEVGNQHNFCWVKPTPENKGQPTQGEKNIFYHGKGATPAWNDKDGKPLIGLIPLNMSANILLVLGANNEEFLSFAPHGAGRNHSRSQLTRGFKDDEGNLMETAVRKSIEDQTKGLDIRWFGGVPDISESPIGYKDAESIKRAINTFRLADVIGEITPLGCIMAGTPPNYGNLRNVRKAARQRQHKAERRRVKQELNHETELGEE